LDRGECRYSSRADTWRGAVALIAIDAAPSRHSGAVLDAVVPGLAAKPVIDIQVAVKNLAATPEIVDALKPLGYQYVPELEAEMPFRRDFRRSANGRRTHQIHLVEQSSTEWWVRHLAFRDWLRRHPKDRER
jgi:GrpB-like predicted nucleotidyltransferase (UPF0157 family)